MNSVLCMWELGAEGWSSVHQWLYCLAALLSWLFVHYHKVVCELEVLVI